MKIIYIVIAIIAVLLAIITTEWTKLLLIPLFILCLHNGMKEKYIFNPFILLISTLVSFLLYWSDLAPTLLEDIPLSSDLLILMCIFAVFLGFCAVRKLKFTPAQTTERNETFILVFVIGLLPTVLDYIIFGNTMDEVGNDLADAKVNNHVPMVNQLAYFLPASIIVACKNNKTSQIVVSLVASYMAALMTVSKTGLLIATMFACVGLFYYKPDIFMASFAKKLKKYALIWLPTVILALFAYNNMMRHEARDDELDYIERGGTDKISTTTMFAQNMYLNYLYYCSPWGNLEYNIKYNNERGYGRNSFAQFAKKVGITIEPVERMEPAYLNTHSFITDFYLDFGYIGAIIASFILGMIIFTMYEKFCFSGNAMLLSCYCVMMFATFMLFFSNHFTHGYTLNYLISMGGYYLLSQKLIPKWKKKEEEKNNSSLIENNKETIECQ